MIVIIGAGPAGMSAAYHLGDADHVILEKEQTAGGLCRSFDLAGATFDLGGHAFFTKHDYVRELVSRLCKPGLFRQPRRAWVHSHGRFVPYPFQGNLHGLPLDVVEECLTGLITAAAAAGNDTPPVDIAEWIERSFGAGIAKHFLVPYNEKLWAFPLTEVTPEWSSQRIVRPDIASIVRGALRPTSFTDFPNATVAYPASGGYSNLYRGFLSVVGDRIRRAAVLTIDARRRRVRTADGREVEFDALVSTMPLDQLVSCTAGLGDCCRAAAASLRHNSLYLVNLVVDRHVTDMHRVYAADARIPFHKLVFNSNSSAQLAERERFAIQAEVSWSSHKRVVRSGLERRVHQALLDMEILSPADEVRACTVVPVPYAYPVYTASTDSARTHLLEELRKLGILCAGRFGEWLYINSDDAVMRGKARAQELMATVPAPS